MKLTIAFSLWIASGIAAAAPVVCTQGERTRSIEVIYSDPGQAVPCEVLYDKATEGMQSTPWRASSEAGYCEARAEALVAKLESLGWSCAASAAPSEPESGGTPSEPESGGTPSEPESNAT